MIVKLLTERHLEAAEARPSLYLSKCQIVGNLMPRLKYSCLKPQGLEPCYLVCSIIYWTSTKFVQIMPLGQKWASPGRHMFYKVLYRENMK